MRNSTVVNPANCEMSIQSALRTLRAPARKLSSAPILHGTTILSVRKDGQVCIVGDGQITLGSMVLKPNANKIRRYEFFIYYEQYGGPLI